ncbi:predicted protein [Uncinocarpus reesii 1704]|uniref:Aminoglycoside phosphotransferase domain-containing protein n=1 Tax=Uncinocarpus reesii (strain UAMH 1704) TaxID=336963 RepID=C4JRC4_UNCRE|nr:uncharacterized protein UREG_05013 [Uncinocarpus reesii 1704]EEP80171.1 predicted protein [Uncinocarpus reesii 1704]
MGARYFASAWLHPEEVTHAKQQESQERISKKLTILGSVLPRRFHSLISSLQADLHHLYSPVYPQVLTHGDLCEMNILVMPETGQISGIVDWADARWKDDENRGQLEEEFWRLFWDAVDVDRNGLKDQLERAVRVARDIGVLLRHGFSWDEGIYEGPVSATDTNSMRYFDALLLSTKQMT